MTKHNDENYWQRRMQQDEKLLWFSRPKPIAKLSGYELFLVVSISAGCLALPLYVFYTDPGFLTSSPVPFWVKMLVGGLAILGVSLLPITLLAKKRHLAKAAYALSNQRAMIARLGKANPVRDFPIASWNDLKLLPKEKNLYVLRFASEVRGSGQYKVVLEHGFEFIEDGPTVHQIMLNLKG